MERHIGERLRLPRYKESFTDETAPGLADSLAEGQPPLCATSMLLRQWYVKYHPDSGPLRIASADVLEEQMGDEMRRVYGDLASHMLRSALSRRRKPVCVGEKTARNWIEKYRRQAPVRRRPAAAPAGVLKRLGAAALADALDNTLESNCAIAQLPGYSP